MKPQAMLTPPVMNVFSRDGLIVMQRPMIAAEKGDGIVDFSVNLKGLPPGDYECEIDGESPNPLRRSLRVVDDGYEGRVEMR